jgi:hypothetical protein
MESREQNNINTEDTQQQKAADDGEQNRREGVM